jgi:hypothetical protein
MPDKLERNRKTVTAFYDLMFNQCRPREAVENVLQVVPPMAANANSMF